LGRLQGTLKHLANTDMVTRTLARREAVMSSQIEGTKSDLRQLLTYEATHDTGGLPADVRITERYVAALRWSLSRDPSLDRTDAANRRCDVRAGTARPGERLHG